MFVIVLIEISDDPVMSIKEAGNMHLADKYMEKQQCWECWWIYKVDNLMTGTGDTFVFEIGQVALVMLVAISSTSLSELISWLMLYRKESYKRTKEEVEKFNKKLEKLKTTHVIQGQNKAHEKKIASTEASLKSLSQSLMLESFKSTLLIGTLTIGVIYLVSSYFSGSVFAILPFEPFSLVRGITHRSLPGEDYSQCSYMLFYILFAFIWRSNLKKLLGFEAPKPAVSFFQPPKYKPE